MENTKAIKAMASYSMMGKADHSDSALHIVIKLQNQLCIEDIFDTFFECINSCHEISGLRYHYPLLSISHASGSQTDAQLTVQLECNDEFLGDVTIYHCGSLSKSAIKHIELVSSLLAHPLRSIIREKAHSLIAANDETMGLCDAALVEQLVTREAKLANREKSPMSIVLFNIDRFNKAVKNYGLITRDTLLFQMMQTIRDNLRDTDLLFRYEANTYCLILKGVTTENSLSVSERIRQAVDKAHFSLSNKKPIHLTISSGIATLNPDDSIETIFSRANKALQHAKKMGRNQSIVADGVFIASARSASNF